MERKYVVFEFNKENCALEISELLEITTLDSLYKSSTSEISVVDWQGQAIPVIDPYSLLTFRHHRPTKSSRVAIVEKKGLKFGVLFDDTKGAMEISDEEINEPMLNEARYIKGVTSSLVKIFDAESLLRKNIVEKFEAVYQLDISVFNDAIHYYEKDDTATEELKEMAKIKILNLIVKATREEMKEEYVQELLEIQRMIVAK